MSGTDVCPCCPKQATSKDGHVRSDSLRTHVKNKHSESFDLDFIDESGWSLRALTPKLVVKHKDGKLGFAYCFNCYHWIDTSGYKMNTEKHIRSHVCIQPQIRQRKCKVVNGTVVVHEKTTTDSMLYKELKAAGADDWIELNDAHDVDIKATFRKLVMAAKTSAPAVAPEGSFLDRLKKDKRLAALQFEEWEQERRDAIEADAELDP